MKTIRLLSAAVILFGAGALHAANAPKADVSTEVVFDHPENFTDIKDSSLQSEAGTQGVLASLRDFLVWKTADLLPPGDRLTIVFTDIDRAGEFEPWRGPQWDDIRIYRDRYPPSFKFTFCVKDATGKVVKEGTENIRDLGYQMRSIISTIDPLRYEKDVLGDWARATLRGLK